MGSVWYPNPLVQCTVYTVLLGSVWYPNPLCTCADTLNVMQWGQFLDHDLAHTPLFRLSNPNATGQFLDHDLAHTPLYRLFIVSNPNATGEQILYTPVSFIYI